MKLTAKQKKQLAVLGRKLGLALLYAYGSRARGDFKADSDLDIAYQPRERLNLREVYVLRKKLVDIMGQSDVDLVDINSAPPLLLYFIATEGQRIYGKERDDDTFYRRALMRFIDAKPLMEATKRYVKEYVGI